MSRKEVMTNAPKNPQDEVSYTVNELDKFPPREYKRTLYTVVEISPHKVVLRREPDGTICELADPGSYYAGNRLEAPAEQFQRWVVHAEPQHKVGAQWTWISNAEVAAIQEGQAAPVSAQAKPEIPDTKLREIAQKVYWAVERYGLDPESEKSGEAVAILRKLVNDAR